MAPFTHTQATKAEASEQEGAPTPTSARRPGPSLPAPLLGGSRASCPSASPSPSANPMEPRRGQPAGGLQPDRTPHHSHCFKSSRHKAMRARVGSETQRPAETENGKGRDKGAESTGDRGQGQRKQGGQEPWGKEQAQKGAFSTRATEW